MEHSWPLHNTQDFCVILSWEQEGVFYAICLQGASQRQLKDKAGRLQMLRTVRSL
jgi:hypothetical protein